MLNNEWDKLTFFSIKNQYYATRDFPFPSLIQKNNTLWKKSDEILGEMEK